MKHYIIVYTLKTLTLLTNFIVFYLFLITYETVI